MDDNKNYNRDVAAIFLELVKAHGLSVCALSDIEIDVMAKAAKVLSANRPQIF